MAFQQGLSGLNAAARHLDTIGHNVANASTVGFKASRAEFADVYAHIEVGFGFLQHIAQVIEVFGCQTFKHKVSKKTINSHFIVVQVGEPVYLGS